MREASAERENAFTRRVCLALHARFVAKKIAAILQGANKGVAVKQAAKIKGDLGGPLLNYLPIVRAGSKRYTRFGNPLPRPSEVKLFLSLLSSLLIVVSDTE